MGIKLYINLLVEVSDFLVGPHVSDFIILVFLKTWNFAEVGGLGGGLVQSVYYEDVDPALGTAGVVFSGVGLIPCPGRIDTPFVWESGRAPGIVLVESEELPVLQDGKILVIDSI